MKPISLTMQNVGPYRGRHEIDLSVGPSLFAIVGPTGSGKSTLLDAIAYALYGATPRLQKRGVGQNMITPGEAAMTVQLTFALNGGTYRVTRSYSAKGKSDLKLERGDSQNFRPVPDCDTIKAAEDKIVELVGLDYDSFTRSIMLPQGEFDEFLKGDSKKRHEVLTRLLGTELVERVRSQANERARSAKERVGFIEETLADYEGVTQATLDQQEKELAAKSERRLFLAETIDKLEEEGEELDRLDLHSRNREKAQNDIDYWVKTEPDIKAIQEWLERSRQAEALLPLLEANREALHDFNEAESAKNERKVELQEAEYSLEAAQANLTEAEKVLKEQGPKLKADLERLEGRLYQFSTLQQGSQHLANELVRAQERRDGAQERLKGLEERYEKAKAQMVAAQERIAAAREAVETADRELNEARDRNAVGLLRARLHEGDECPVCSQRVDTVPPVIERTGLNDLREALKAAQEEESQAAAHLHGIAVQIGELANERIPEAQDAVIKFEREALQAENALVTELAEFDLGDDPLAGRKALIDSLAEELAAEVGDDPIKHVEDLALRLTKMEQAVEEARKRIETVTGEHGFAAERFEEAAEAASRAEKRLEGATSRYNKARRDAGFDEDTILEDLILPEKEQDRLREQANQWTIKLQNARSRLAEAEKGLGGRKYDPERHRAVNGEWDAAKNEYEDLLGEIGELRRTIADTQNRLEWAEELRGELKTARDNYAIYGNLAQNLRRDKFQSYLLATAQADLAAQASRTIGEITAGRYRLEFDGDEFMVQDTWYDDALRSVRTLSGGETFIVSLALALALSDVISGKTRLETLFLDEGFGTLDPQMLDAVAGTLTQLSKARRVGIITHIEALTDRLPARLRIERRGETSTARWE